jgi:hypothetical protein
MVSYSMVRMNPKHALIGKTARRLDALAVTRCSDRFAADPDAMPGVA